MAEDYLNMIKNPPKRRPSNSPAPGPSNTSRGSSPFPNPIIAPSTNAPYINNLDRLKSFEGQNSSGNNFPVRQNYEPVRRDASPNSNRFSAPISSIGERAGIPGPSFYGDVPQQPQNILGGYKPSFTDLASTSRDPVRDRSPTGNLYGTNTDVSPRGRMLGANVSSGTNARPLRVGTGSINSNTGLFGDSSYKGSTGDSISHRKGSGSQQSGAMKFSGGNKVNQDVSPKFGGRRDRSPMIRKSKKKKMEIPLIILGVLLVILIAVAAVVLLIPKPVNFCDSKLAPGKKQRPDCVPCPEHGMCEGGNLVSCKDKFKKYKNECVEDYETAKKYGQYRSYINDRLAYYKGEKLCDPTIKDYLTLSEIKAELQTKYGPKDKEIEGNIRFDKRWDDYFEKEEGLNREDQPGEEIYTTLDEGSPSLSCKCRLLWREGKLAGVWLGLFIGTVVLAVKLIRLHVVYSRLGREMYDDVREYLTHFKNVSVKTLKKEFEHKYPGKNFEKIWSYVESYRKNDARIYQYFDIYQGVNQEFWLRVR